MAFIEIGSISEIELSALDKKQDPPQNPFVRRFKAVIERIKADPVVQLIQEELSTDPLPKVDTSFYIEILDHSRDCHPCNRLLTFAGTLPPENENPDYLKALIENRLVKHTFNPQV